LVKQLLHRSDFRTDPTPHISILAILLVSPILRIETAFFRQIMAGRYNHGTNSRIGENFQQQRMRHPTIDVTPWAKLRIQQLGNHAETLGFKVMLTS
jgi:hypothetical protein